MGATVPKVFSLIENPAETMVFIQAFRDLIEYGSLRTINLDYTGCEKLDLCASVVLDVLALRAKRQRAFRNKKLGFKGTFSARPEINLMLRSSGMLKQPGVGYVSKHSSQVAGAPSLL